MHFLVTVCPCTIICLRCMSCMSYVVGVKASINCTIFHKHHKLRLHSEMILVIYVGTHWNCINHSLVVLTEYFFQCYRLWYWLWSLQFFLCILTVTTSNSSLSYCLGSWFWRNWLICWRVGQRWTELGPAQLFLLQWLSNWSQNREGWPLILQEPWLGGFLSFLDCASSKRLMRRFLKQNCLQNRFRNHQAWKNIHPFSSGVARRRIAFHQAC